MNLVRLSDVELDKIAVPEPTPCDPSDLLSRKSVEAYLNETGLTVSLINKNDKKFVKVNIAANMPNTALRLKNSPVVETQTLKIVEMLDLTAQKCPIEGSNENGMIFSEHDLEKLLGLSASEFNSQLDNIECERMVDPPSFEASKPADDEPIALKFICANCDERFESQSELNQHLAHSHPHPSINRSMPKRFDCGVCGMYFYDVSSKNRHEKEHAGLKPFRCYICSFEFTRASNLRAHLLKLHPGQIGKSVKITKTIENKLQFEFNLGKLLEIRHARSKTSSISNFN